MANRRSINVTAMTAPLQNMLNMIMQNQYRRQSMQDENQLIIGRQKLMDEQKFRETLLQKAMSDPMFARRLQSSGLMPEAGAFVPSNEELAKGISDSIGKATDEKNLPTDEDLTASLRASGGDVSPVLGSLPSPSQDGTLPSTQYQPRQNPTLNQLQGQRNARASFLDKERISSRRDMPVDFTRIGANGNSERVFTTRGAAEDLGPIQSERTGQQQGQYEADTALNGALSPKVSSAKARQAGQVAGAEENARLGAQFSPANIEGAGRLAESKAKGESAGKGPTDTEKSAAQFYVRAVSADAEAKALEQKGATGFGSAVVPELVKSDVNKRYSTAKANFIQDVIYLQSGKQINAEELKQYEKAWFAQPGDDPAQIEQKARFRQDALEGVKYLAKKGIDDMNRLGFPTTLRPGDALDALRKTGGKQ